MATKDINIRLGLIFDERSLNSLERKLRSSGERLNRIGDALTLSISAPLAALGVAAVKSAGDMQSLELALKSQLGSAEAAKKEIEALTEAAKNPGLGVEQAVRGSVRLQGVGFAADEARETLVQFGNALAATGGTADDLDRVTRQFAQMTSKGRVLQEDISVIAESMPGMAQLMQKAFGTQSVEAIRDMGVSGKEFVLAITQAAKELPRVEGGIKNSIGNAMDAIKQSAARVGEAINNAFDIAGAAESFGNFLIGLAEGFSNLSPAAQSFAVYLGAALVAAGPLAKLFGSVQLISSQLVGVWGSMIGVLKGVSGWIATTATAFNALNLATKAFVGIGLIIAITQIAYSLGAFNKELTIAEKAQRELTNVELEAKKAIASEKSEVDRLVAVIDSEVTTREAKGRALKKLQQISPQYFGQLREENGLVVGLNESYQKYVTAILQAARVEAAKGKIVELERELLDIEDTRLERRKEAANVAAFLTGNAQSGLERETAQYQRQIAEINAKKEALTKVVIANENLSISTDKVKDKEKDKTDATEDAIRAAKLYKEVISDIARVKDRQDILGSEKVLEQAKAIENGINRLLDGGFAPASKAVQGLKEQLKGLFPEKLKNFDLLPTLATPTSVSSQTPIAGPQAVDTSGVKSLSQAYVELAEKLQSISTINSTFGTSQETLKQQLEAVRSAIQTAIESGYSPQSTALAAMIEQYNQLNAVLEENINKQQRIEALAQGISAIGQVMSEALMQGGQSFQDFARSAIGAIGDVIGQMIKLAVASAFTGSLKAGAALGPIGLAIAGAVGGLAASLFKKVVGSATYARGTNFASGGLSLVGEQGPELMNVPRGAQILSNRRTNNMLSSLGGGGGTIDGEFRLKGTDLVLALERTQNKNKRIR